MMPRRWWLCSLLLCSVPAFGAGKTTRIETSSTPPVGVRTVRLDGGPPLFLDAETVEPTFSLTLVDARDRAVTVSGHSPCQRAEVTAENDGAHLEWIGIPVDGRGTVDVRVRFSARGDGLVDGFIEVVSHAPHCRLTAIDFPHLELRATPSAAEDITLVWPRAFGRSWRNPFHGPKGFLVGTQEPYGMRTEMSFGAMIDDKGNGLYWAAYDPELRAKRFFYTTGNGAMTMKIRQIPDDVMTAGLGYRSPYPVVLGAFRGDWWDAAHLYRQWAVQQKWCARGPLADRQDTPQWIRRADLWIRGDSRHTSEIHSAFNRRMLHTFGGPIGVQWYNWGPVVGPKRVDDWGDPARWPPREGVAEMWRQGRANGLMAMPYINAIQWNPRASSFAPLSASDAMLLPDGRRRRGQATGSGGDGNWVICATRKMWQEKLIAAAERVVIAGAAGVYLDQLGRQMTDLCCDPAHGHSPGGGSAQTEALRAMLARMRRRLRAAWPEAAMVGESQPECFIDVTDGRLIHYNVWPGWLPLWAAVYGDYTTTFGRTLTPGSANADEDVDFFARAGNTFVSGVQLARFWVTGSDRTLWSPAYAEHRRFIAELLAYRRLAREYLEYGWLQRPVRWMVAPPSLTIRDGKERPMSMPAVVSSVWQATDGSLAFFFVNVSPKPVEVEWDADLRRYPPETAVATAAEVVSLDGASQPLIIRDARLHRRPRLRPRSVEMVRVRRVLNPNQHGTHRNHQPLPPAPDGGGRRASRTRPAKFARCYRPAPGFRPCPPSAPQARRGQTI